jgi:hypothetical protein
LYIYSIGKQIRPTEKNKNMQDVNSNKVVYLHKRVSNGQPFYVGIGGPNRPYNFHARTEAWRGIALRENNNIEVEIVAQGVTPEEALEIEAQYISRFGRIGIEEGGILVNRSARGFSGGKQTEEHKRKRSLAMQGKNLGRKYSDEAKAKIGAASKAMWERRRNGN